MQAKEVSIGTNIPSMSRKGNCYDNAQMESFFGTLKRESVHHRKYRTRQEAIVEISEYIEVFYNQSTKETCQLRQYFPSSVLEEICQPTKSRLKHFYGVRYCEPISRYPSLLRS